MDFQQGAQRDAVAKELLARLRCPVCQADQLLSRQQDTPLQRGVIECNACNKTFEIVDDIIHFCIPRIPVSGVDYTCANWVERERERERVFERENGFNHEWLRTLPFPRSEIDTTFQKKNGALGANFFNVVQRLALRGDECVLDLAAGCCWTSNEFAKRGCKVVATDIRTVKYHGLRSAEAYFETGRTCFGRLCWAFGRIPFQDETFDIVFCQNGFQYVEDLSLLCAEIFRVLKPGGRFVLAWTGTRGLLKSKDWGPGHSLRAYRSHARRAGFLSQVFPPSSLYENLDSLAAGRHGAIAVPARLLSAAFKCMPLLRSACVALAGSTAVWLFGTPFNMVAIKHRSI